jgi:polyphenol oxidase
MSTPSIISSRILSRFPQIRYGMSTRLGGVSPEPFGMNLSFRVGDESGNVERNRVRFFGSLGFDPRSLAIPHQCHSNVVQIVNQAGDYESCDGLVTNATGLPLVITIADCMPIVLFDPKKAVLAHVHAGWRGSEGRITKKAVDIMEQQFGVSSRDIVAFLGPSAGVCCYEVGREVSDAFAPEDSEMRNGRIFLDLKKANVSQLRQCGIQSANIEVSTQCTICGSDLFHSYRRDRERSGRMMAVVSLLRTQEQ